VNKKLNELVLEEFVNALISEEKRRIDKKNGGQEDNAAFFNKEKGKKKTEKKTNVCFNCNKAGYISKDCTIEKRTCYNCNKLGHIAPHCKLPKRSKDKYDSNGSAHTVKESNESKNLFFMFMKVKEQRMFG